jgi:hypothetical protein
VRKIFLVGLVFSWALMVRSQPLAPGQSPMTPGEAQALVDRALANELRAAEDANHPMRYLLRKVTPRLTTTKEIYETKDGDVARLRSVDDRPLSAEAEEKEQERLAALDKGPGRQRHRKQEETEDAARALAVLRALPSAFQYRYAGQAESAGGMVEKFDFRPDPDFSPPDLETQILKSMAGEIWIDPAQERVTRLKGRLERDVDFAWGLLGRLDKGGWIEIDQADVGGGQWRTVRLQITMSARVFFKSRDFDTVEEESRFAPLPVGLGYRQAIEMLRANGGADTESLR